MCPGIWVQAPSNVSHKNGSTMKRAAVTTRANPIYTMLNERCQTQEEHVACDSIHIMFKNRQDRCYLEMHV